jgi:hypothetical protein
MSEQKKKLLIPIIIACMVISSLTTLTICSLKFKGKIHKEIEQYKGQTIGIVTRYGSEGKSVAKSITYEYRVMISKGGGALVKEELFTGDAGGAQAPDLLTECKKQNCPNCIGAKFKVEYSTKNPHYCRVIIGKDTIARSWQPFEW